MAQAHRASHNVVHLPLRPDVAAKFNLTRARAFFAAHEGADYGFGNLLWGWQDNEGNYMYPLSPELHQLLPALIGKFVPAVADLLWNRAFNVRTKTNKYDTGDGDGDSDGDDVGDFDVDDGGDDDVMLAPTRDIY
jgi:hypothetical protein